MRIAIREQFVALVLLVALIALAVVSISVWITTQDFVLSIRSTRLSLTSSVKASQLETVLTLMMTIVRAASSRIRIQAYLREYAAGNSNISAQADALTDLQSSISPYDTSNLGYQSALYAVSPATGTYQQLLNASNGEISLNYPSLYPNLTLRNGNTYYGDQRLDFNSSLLLGPEIVNSTLAMVSVTLPVTDLQTTTNRTIIGFLTIVMSSSALSDVVASLEGLGSTGTTLIVGPITRNNKFPAVVPDSPSTAMNATAISDLEVRFVFPPLERQNSDARHSMRDFGAEVGRGFSVGSYPAVQYALASDQDAINNAGNLLSTTNEQGARVGVGYAVVRSTLAEWVVVVEWAEAEVFQPITQLRNLLLACVFGTTGALLIVVWPIAHLSIRPIRRLREATLHTVNSPDDDSTEKHASFVEVSSSSGGDSNGESNVSPSVRKDPSKSIVIEHIRRLVSRRSSNPKSGHVPGTFRIPSKVRQRRHWVKDELTELTDTFNEMTEELLLQYERLEERVRQRTAELELSKQAAEAANESKTLFIANVSHELKTPLNGILGMCAVCMQETDMSKIKQSLSTMYNSGDLLLTLLTDLLTFNKNQAGQHLVLDEKVFRLHDISTQLRAIFDNQASTSGINFNIAFEGMFDSQGRRPEGDTVRKFGPPGTGKVKRMKCKGDLHRILQVVINLVSNALKFTPSGGSVTLTIKCRAHQSGGNTTPSRKSSQQSFGSKKTLPQFKMLAGRRSSVPDMSSKTSQPDTTRSSFVAQPVEMPTEMFWFEFQVTDTGLGIAKDMQESIFEPFVQGDLQLTKKYGGAGLGLSICSQLAKLMNGSVTVESELDKGSTFVLRIPLEYVGISTHVNAMGLEGSADLLRIGTTDYDINSDFDAPTPEETIKRASDALHLDGTGKPRLIGLSEPFFGNAPLSSPEDEDPRGGRLKVLVAEDNKVNQEVVLRMLKLEDVYDVEIAKDGQEALDKVKASLAAESPYDLILMDVQMPVLDGRQSTRLIREHGFKSPIVALSAFSDEINQRECLESGMDYFLAKPIKRPALRRVLRTYCPTIDEQPEDEHECPSPRSKSVSRTARRSSEIHSLDLIRTATEAS